MRARRTTLFQALLQGMKETREQASAVTEAFKREVYGDEEYIREVGKTRALDEHTARNEPPPDTTLHGLKRSILARRLKGR